MANLNCLLVLYILAFSQEIALASVNVNSFVCYFDPQYFANSYCSVTKSRHKPTYLNSGCTCINGLDKLTVASGRRMNNKYEMFGPQVKQNLCEISKANTLDYFSKRIFTMIFKHLKSVRCPLKGNFSVNKYAFMMPMPQGLMPASDYLINTVVTRERHTLVDANVSFTVTV